MNSLNYFDSHGVEIYHCALMFLTMPPRLEPFQAADKQTRFQGEMKLADLERIAAESQHTEGVTVRVDLQFYRDKQGKVRMTGDLSTRVQTTCQRCLQPMWLDVSAHPKLVLLRSRKDSEPFADDFEPLAVDVEGLDLKQLVDEELILNLPIVAMHSQSECELHPSAVREEELIDVDNPPKDNPFAILAALKDSNKLDE